MDLTHTLIIRWLDRQEYVSCWQAMKQFTDRRQQDTPDEIWLLEHNPVFTQGQNGKAEHILHAGNIPIVQTDRGGQVTYHGPGQLMIYTLLDLKRKKLTIRELVSKLEQSVIDFLAGQQVNAIAKREAPGVYVNGKKICSIGLRVRKGCAYHGIAFNIHLDLEPFNRINPCGFTGLQMTQLSELSNIKSVRLAGEQLIGHLMKNLGYNTLQQRHETAF